MWMAWHGPAGLEVLKCLPGAHPLVLLGNAIATNLPTIEIPAKAAPVVLLGRFRSIGTRLALRRPDALSADQEAQMSTAFPAYGRFDYLELVSDEGQLRSGDVLVTEDGHLHELTGEGILSRLDAATGRVSLAISPVPLRDYLEHRDMAELPLARMTRPTSRSAGSGCGADDPGPGYLDRQ